MNPAPRKTRKRFEIAGQARFLTFSTFRRVALFDDPALCDAFAAQLARTREPLKFGLLAWVIMPDHVHLLLVPDIAIAPVTVILHRLKMGFTRGVLGDWRRAGDRRIHQFRDARGQTSLWQRGGGFDRNVNLDGELMEKLQYIHSNPVRKGLCAAPHEWQWSSAAWYADPALRARAIVAVDSHLLDC